MLVISSEANKPVFRPLSFLSVSCSTRNLLTFWGWWKLREVQRSWGLGRVGYLEKLDDVVLS